MTFRVRDAAVFGGIVALTALYLFVVVTVMLPAADGTPRAIIKGWGDVAYHLDIIETLAANDLVRFEQPIAAGMPLTYPFVIDWISAALRKLGFPVFAAFHIPAILFGILLVWALWRLARGVLKHKVLALAFVAIVLFGGGLGFWQFFSDLAAGAPFSHEYTHLDDRTGGKLAGMAAPYNIVWITPAISFFSHQRSFIPGAALGALILWGLMRRKWGWIAAVGFLPLIHAHTFLAFAMIVASFIIADAAALLGVRRRHADLPPSSLGLRNFFTSLRVPAGFVLLAGLIALPQVWYLLAGKSDGAFFQWWPWWMARGKEPAIWFWTKNFGVVFWAWVWVAGAAVLLGVRRRVVPATTRVSLSPRRLAFGETKPVGAARASSNHRLARDLDSRSENASTAYTPLLVASMVVFAAGNLVKFQPWEFDNNKIFFWWWLLAVLLILSAIQSVIETRRKWGITLLVLFVFFATCAGFLDIAGRFVRLNESLFGYYGETEVEAGEWIRRNTAPGEVFLTADRANVFVPMLTGRPIYLGFTGWLWTQGRAALVKERRQTIEQFLASGNPRELCRDAVRYMIWDWQFEEAYPTARRDVIAASVEPVFRQEAPMGVREILKLKCP